MGTLCLYVKPTATQPGTRLMSVTCLGPQWTGRRLRLQRPDRLGLRETDLIGWSDFYAGSACDVHVARRRTASVRVGWCGAARSGCGRCPPELVDGDVEAVRDGGWDARPVLWVEDASLLPEDVRAVVDRGTTGGGATVPS